MENKDIQIKVETANQTVFKRKLLVLVRLGSGINLCNFFPINVPLDGGATSCFIYKKLI